MIRTARFVVTVALVAIPFSYATKMLLGIPDIIWIDPTLVLGFVAFLIWRPRDRAGFALVVFAFLSALIGSWLMPASLDRTRSPAYVYCFEPIRLTLNVIWFWVVVDWLRRDRDLVVRWFSVGVLVQAAISVYLYLALYDAVPASPAMQIYLQFYKLRQVVWWHDTPIYRMAGTFDESPLYGLFMFSAFVVLALALAGKTKLERTTRRLAMTGAVLSFLGAVASLSDQVLGAIVLFGIAFLWAIAQSTPQPTWIDFTRKRAFQFAIAFVVLGASIYVGSRVVTKFNETPAASVMPGDVVAGSARERWFHTLYAFRIFAEQPATLILGIGPGRYGDYAARTGFWPSTVTPQVTPVEWLVEYGLIGFALIIAWLGRIASAVGSAYGWLGKTALASLLIAVMLQANWKWEGWFLALAYLYAAGPVEHLASTAEVGTNTGGALARAGL